MTFKELVETPDWKKLMKRLERYSIVGLAITLLFIIFDLKFAKVLLILTLSIYATFNFFKAFENFESNSRIISLLFYKIYGYGLSLACVTVMFGMMNWPHPKEIWMIASLLSIGISGFLGYREMSGENINKINWMFFARLLIALLLFLYLLV